MRLRNFALGAFFCLQIWLPLSYYLGDDPSDERFAWRMFSATRLSKCKAEVVASQHSGPETRLDAREHLHVAWVTNMTRNRKRVIEAYLERVCDDGYSSAKLTNECVLPSKEKQSFVYEIACESREFMRVGP